MMFICIEFNYFNGIRVLDYFLEWNFPIGSWGCYTHIELCCHTLFETGESAFALVET
jgi:hypothetical protein